MEKRSPIWHFASVLAVGIVGIIASLAIWYLTFASENRAFIQEFESRSENQASILQNGVNDFWDKLYALRAFVNASNHAITREEFESFSNSLIDDHPAIVNMTWAPRIRRGERLAHELAATRQGVPDYHIRAFAPDGSLSISPERDEYFPKFYTTELRTAPVYGLDLNDDGARGRTLTRSRDANVLSASPPQLLVGLGDPPGFWVALPVYARSLPHETLEDRRRNLRGFVQAVFQIRVMVDKIYGGAKAPVRVYLFPPNAAVDDPSIYFASRLGIEPIEAKSQTGLAAELYRSFPLKFGDIQWTMVVAPEAAGFMSATHQQSWLVLITGLLLSGGLTSFIWAMHNNARNLQISHEKLSNREIERDRAEDSLRESEQDHRAILESMAEPYYEVDLKGDLVLINTAFRQLLGYPEHELLGMNNREFQVPEVAARVFQKFNNVYRTGVPTTGYDWELVRKDGSKVLVEASIHLIKDADGQPVGFRGMLRDVTTRRQDEQALRESKERFRSLTELSSDWYWEQDSEFRFVRLEGRGKSTFENYLGKTAEEIGFDVMDSGSESYRGPQEARKPYRDVVMSYILRGEHRYFNVSGEPIFSDDGRFRGYRGVSRDITERKRAEQRIQYLATHDELTGIPNRAKFSRTLNVAIESARHRDGKFAVLFIDLDRFKTINDSLGHAPGDTLLKETAARLGQVLRCNDVVARLGGDEFVVLVEEVNEIEQVKTVARKILSAVIKPVDLMGQECRVTASIGISMYPADGQDEQSLMKNADIAMYRAKDEGKNNYRFYSRDMMGHSIERLMLDTGLRHALERNEFFLHYQPKRDLRTGQITGVEALLRWQHPELGVVSPSQFIPLAEDTGLIVPIGKWVLETACAQAMAWQRQGLPPVHMAVNLSARQFADENLLTDIATLLQETGLMPELLELEITESMVMQDPERAIKLLAAIKQLGVRLAIDDFGTGYSSMALLKRFPIDILKIDRSFIREIPKNAEDNAIADAIIAMGKALNLTVVAEGVETAEQERFLREHACDEIQGYYFSRPVAHDAFADLQRQHMISQLKALASQPLQSAGRKKALGGGLNHAHGSFAANAIRH